MGIKILIGVIIFLVFLLGLLFILAPRTETVWNSEYERQLPPGVNLSKEPSNKFKFQGYFLVNNGVCQTELTPNLAVPYIIENLDTNETYKLQMTNISTGAANQKCATTPQDVVSVTSGAPVYSGNTLPGGLYSVPYAGSSIQFVNAATPGSPLPFESEEITPGFLQSVPWDSVIKYTIKGAKATAKIVELFA